MRTDTASGMGSRDPSASLSTSHSSTHAFLDGIQMRLTDKYKPQKRVILPADYVNRLQEDIEAILDLDYDFKLEEQVLAAYKHEHEIKEETSQSWPAAVDGVSAVNPSALNAPVSSDTNKVKSGGPPPRPPPPVPSAGKDGSSGVSMNPLLASVSYRPMEPQKARLPGASTETSQNASRGFRVEDFEPNTANPFDHLELKSLNDMEQLQQVLANDKESSNSA